MTEAEWPASIDPCRLLSAICSVEEYAHSPEGDQFERKKTLFTFAAYRCTWKLLPGPCRSLIEQGERTPEQPGWLRTREEMYALDEALNEALEAARTEADIASIDQLHAFAFAGWNRSPAPAVPRVVLESLCFLLRDIFGNPFRPAALSPIGTKNARSERRSGHCCRSDLILARSRPRGYSLR